LSCFITNFLVIPTGKAWSDLNLRSFGDENVIGFQKTIQTRCYNNKQQCKIRRKYYAKNFILWWCYATKNNVYISFYSQISRFWWVISWDDIITVSCCVYRCRKHVSMLLVPFRLLVAIILRFILGDSNSFPKKKKKKKNKKLKNTIS
jgi:hypothetical protein